jgi:hypothetical protein
MSALNAIRDCLLSREAKVLDLRSEFPVPPDPIVWAHRVSSAHPDEVRVQAMPQTVNADVAVRDRALALAPDAAPELVRNLLAGIARGAAAHASMELWHADSFGERVADPASLPYKSFVSEGLGPRQRALHPVGYYSKLTLWFSADAHRYAAHCDVADGMLFQLRGEKVVEVWPVPESYGQRILFDHAYATEPVTTRGRSYKLSAGQALFIPAGAMHEVVVGPDQISVSMSLHTGSPFPVMELCRDLNYMSRDTGVFGLPAEMLHRDKFRVFYFAPALLGAEHHQAAMPGELREALLSALLRPQGYSRDRLSDLLDIWWRNALTTPRYPGPYPHPEELTDFKGAGA